jgi:UDP-arabinose 4-epimerase
MKVLVTGGAGYIGSHTCKALALSGHDPIALDNLSMGHKWAVRWGPLEHVELADTKRVVDVIRHHRIEAVIHFAANAYVGESMLEPLKYFNNNVGGTLSLLTAMQETQVSILVFSSTCATYGCPTELPITESTPLVPINPYGESKLMVERCLKWLGDRKELRWTALRYFNAAGADPLAEIGEEHEPETHLIPLAIRACINDSTVRLKIFGSDYATADGTAIRDYVHVTDLAAAHVAALEALLIRTLNCSINLGTGHGTSVMQIVNAIQTVAGKPLRHDFYPRRPGDPDILVADNNRARELLAWTPQRSAIENIVEDAIRWETGAVRKRFSRATGMAAAYEEACDRPLIVRNP